MNWLPERDVLRQQLKLWAFRGGCCAAPSFLWALLVGFAKPAALLGIAAGVATWIAAYSLITALPVYRARVEGGAWGWALSVGANTRAALAPLMTFGPDMFLGTVALNMVSRITGLRAIPYLKMEEVFSTTYLTTLVQGALISATMFLLVLPLWGARALWLRRK